jgi:hypothetical protein
LLKGATPKYALNQVLTLFAWNRLLISNWTEATWVGWRR